MMALAQGKAPLPEFAVEMNFQSTMAERLAERCDGLDFDHAGSKRHMLALLAKFSDRGIPARELGTYFAPVAPERYDPYFAAFLKKYDLTEDSPQQGYCNAGYAAAEWRTPIGRMLKIVAQ
ncbi:MULTISPECIES: DUF5333 family protein [unclassified Sulfitobacter]|uniref:DUF5333 family protein n=1 Tax=unclassified Sulfitobacter TaxID=196795 RepID=UPI0023E09FA6|nr:MULTISPECIES: DUF5333 family protein [unclassified Sulfitobacter]MDF3512682.1 hypothetical protein [Sulfitobacter sp. M36]